MNVFDKVPVKKPDKNLFNLSHDVKMTMKFDYVYPFLCREVYPGSTFNCRSEVFLRSQPLICPILHNVDLKIYFFFVPNRLVWKGEDTITDSSTGVTRKALDSWQTFITGGELGNFNIVPPHFTYKSLSRLRLEPQDITTLFSSGSLMDYLGYPTSPENPSGFTNDTPVSILPFRGYQLIYNEYFRNQNVSPEVEIPQGSGNDFEQGRSVVRLFRLRKKCWEKDYFTSCLPFVQRGEAVKIPIKATGRLNYEPINSDVGSGRVTLNTKEGVLANTEMSDIKTNSLGQLVYKKTTPNIGVQVDVGQNYEVLVENIEGTINDLRLAYRLQRWLENNARCGSRYIEQLFSHFGVVSSDARLQRPELLGGGTIPLIISDVEQSAPSAVDGSSLANLGGKGTAYGKTGGFKKYFEEHGFLFGVCCMVPRTSYQDQVPRQFLRMTRFDYYFPEFANLGEQAVTNAEVYFNPISSSEQTSAIFGYQQRFGELRYIPSTVHGDMKGSLQSWHLGRTFSKQPALNQQFVEANSRVNCFAPNDVQDLREDPFLLEMHLDIKALQPLPKFAVPTF